MRTTRSKLPSLSPLKTSPLTSLTRSYLGIPIVIIADRKHVKSPPMPTKLSQSYRLILIALVGLSHSEENTAPTTTPLLLFSLLEILLPQ